MGGWKEFDSSCRGRNNGTWSGKRGKKCWLDTWSHTDTWGLSVPKPWMLLVSKRCYDFAFLFNPSVGKIVGGPQFSNHLHKTVLAVRWPLHILVSKVPRDLVHFRAVLNIRITEYLINYQILSNHLPNSNIQMQDSESERRFFFMKWKKLHNRGSF